MMDPTELVAEFRIFPHVGYYCQSIPHTGDENSRSVLFNSVATTFFDFFVSNGGFSGFIEENWNFCLLQELAVSTV